MKLISLALLLCVLLLSSSAAREQLLTQTSGPCTIPNFTGPTNINVLAPRALVVGDFNKDGKLDLAAANNRTSGTVSILLGNGNGGFSAPTNFSGGRNPTFLASGDFNGDGNADLAIANESNAQGEVSILLGNGAGGFGAQTSIRIINGSQNLTAALAIGDVNGDGKADLVLASATFNSVFILLGSGMGTFTFFKSFSSGGFSPANVAMRDLNADGKLDLVVANSAAAPNQSFGNVATLLGDGAGDFGTAVTFAVGASPTSIAIADFNGDNKLDLAVANTGVSSFSVLIGDGAGNFNATTSYDAHGTFPQSVLQGDFNSDGKIDLAVLNPVPGTAVIFLGDGVGGFSPVANFESGRLANLGMGLVGAVGDFNGDGRADLAAANDSAGRVSVLLNTCGSATATKIQLSGRSGSEENSLSANGSAMITVTRIGDITGAGSVDYATSNGTAVAPQDYTAVAGTLNFTAGETFQTIPIPIVNDNITEGVETFNVTLSNAAGGASLGSPSTAELFLFDNDPPPTISISDVTIAEGNSGVTNANFVVSLSNPSASTITMNYATADGAATAGSDYQTKSGMLTFNPGEVSKIISVVVNVDILAEVNETFFVNLSNPTNATFADSQGLGTIEDDDSACPGPSFGGPIDSTVGSNPTDLVVGDFNADGKSDLAVANQVSNNVSILLAAGGGGFGAATNIAVGPGPVRILAADLNLDGKLDLVTANLQSGGGSDTSISILLGNGGGTFTAATTIRPVPNIRGVAVGDVNLDGKLDLAIVSTLPFIGPSTVSILLGNGAGGFGGPTNYATGSTSLFVAVADLNGDGKLDLVTSNLQSHDLSVLINNGDGTFAAATSIPAGTNPQSVVAADMNGDGKLDLVVPNGSGTGNVLILIGNGSGGFSAGSSLTFGMQLYRVAAADLNADGNVDLAVADPATGSGASVGGIWVLFSNGMGNFTTPTKYTVGTNPVAVVSGDFNNDGKLDLANTNLNQPNTISILFNTCSAVPTPMWLPVVLTANQTELKSWILQGRAYVYVKLLFPNAGYRVTNWGQPVQTGHDFTVNAAVERFTGPSVQSITTTAQIYDLGPLSAGNYSFDFKTSGTVVKNLQFTVSSTVPPPNPIDDARQFVKQQYRDFLNREADQAGEDFWTDNITKCLDPARRPAGQTEAQCTLRQRETTSGAFFLSPEFQYTGYLVYRMYQGVLGRQPKLSEFTPDALTVGNGIIVNGQLSGMKINQNKAAFAAEFVNCVDPTNYRCAEFKAIYDSLSNQAFVDKLFQTTGINASAADRAALVNGLNANPATETRASVVQKVVDGINVISEGNQQFTTTYGQAFYNAELNRAFVQLEYFGYMRRDPDDAGYAFWLAKLNQFGGDFVAAEMVLAFISSPEYRARFGQP